MVFFHVDFVSFVFSLVIVLSYKYCESLQSKWILEYLDDANMCVVGSLFCIDFATISKRMFV